MGNQMEYTLDGLDRGADFLGGALNVGKDAEGNAADSFSSRAKKYVLRGRCMQMLRNELALLSIDASLLHGRTENKTNALVGGVDGVHEHSDSNGRVMAESIERVAGELAVLFVHCGISWMEDEYILKYLRKAVRQA